MTCPSGLLERHKAITTLTTITAVTVASSQPLYFCLEISLNNINFYTAPPEKLRTFQHYAITASEANVSNTPKKKRTKKEQVLHFPLIDDPVKYLNWLRLGKLFHITFFKHSI